MQFHSTDSLVSKPDWNIVVQKTGYISQAGRCLVMQTVIEERTVVIVLLNSFGKRTRVADATRIRKWMEATVAHAAGAARDHLNRLPAAVPAARLTPVSLLRCAPLRRAARCS